MLAILLLIHRASGCDQGSPESRMVMKLRMVMMIRRMVMMATRIIMTMPAGELSGLSWPADHLARGQLFHWEGLADPPGAQMMMVMMIRLFEQKSLIHLLARWRDNSNKSPIFQLDKGSWTRGCQI